MTPRDLFLVALVCLAWGFNAVAIKVGCDHFPPILFGAMRNGIVLIVMLPWLRAVGPGQAPTLLISTFFNGALHFALIYTGTMLSSASIMAIVDQLYVPFAALLAMWWLHERVGWRRWAGIGVAFVGMAVFSAEGNVAPHWEGLLFLVADAVSMAAGSVLFRRLTVSPWVMQAWMAGLAFPALMLGSVIFESGQWAAIVAAPWQGWAALIYTVVGGSLIGFTGYYLLLQRYEVSLVGALCLISPVISVIAGVLMLHEPFTLQIGVGALIVLAGVGVVLMREDLRKLEPPEGV